MKSYSLPVLFVKHQKQTSAPSTNTVYHSRANIVSFLLLTFQPTTLFSFTISKTADRLNGAEAKRLKENFLSINLPSSQKEARFLGRHDFLWGGMRDKRSKS